MTLLKRGLHCHDAPELERTIRHLAIVHPDAQYVDYGAGAIQAASAIRQSADDQFRKAGVDDGVWRPWVTVRGQLPDGGMLPEPFNSLCLEIHPDFTWQGYILLVGRVGADGSLTPDEELESHLARYTGKMRLQLPGTINIRVRSEGRKIVLPVMPVLEQTARALSLPRANLLDLSAQGLVSRLLEFDSAPLVTESYKVQSTQANWTLCTVATSNVAISATFTDGLKYYRPWSGSRGVLSAERREGRPRSRRPDWEGLQLRIGSCQAQMPWLTPVDDPVIATQIERWTERLFQQLRRLEAEPLSVDVPERHPSTESVSADECAAD